jgi:hypothetical protein
VPVAMIEFGTDHRLADRSKMSRVRDAPWRQKTPPRETGQPANPLCATYRAICHAQSARPTRLSLLPLAILFRVLPCSSVAK